VKEGGTIAPNQEIAYEKFSVFMLEHWWSLLCSPCW